MGFSSSQAGIHNICIAFSLQPTCRGAEKFLLEVKTSYRDFTRAEQDRLLQSFKLTVVFRDLVCTQLVNSKTNKIEAENVRKVIATKKQEFPLNAA